MLNPTLRFNNKKNPFFLNEVDIVGRRSQLISFNHSGFHTQSLDKLLHRSEISIFFLLFLSCKSNKREKKHIIDKWYCCINGYRRELRWGLNNQHLPNYGFDQCYLISSQLLNFGLEEGGKNFYFHHYFVFVLFYFFIHANSCCFKMLFSDVFSYLLICFYFIWLH